MDATATPQADLVWQDGRLVPFAEATTHVLTHALHYGTAVFDSLRVYPTPDGPAIFRHADHVARLLRSARLYKLDVPYTADELLAAGRELVRANGFGGGTYVRQLVFRGAGAMGVAPYGAPVRVAIAAWPWGAYLGADAAETGIRVRVASWRRIGPDALQPAAKATAHYLNSVLAKVEAHESGCDEAILLDGAGMVGEGTGENLFVVAAGRLVTPPTTGPILAGITRDTILALARDLGVAVKERPIARSELHVADELFLTGTAAEVTPVREVDGYPVGDGRPGVVTTRLRAAFAAAAEGRDASHTDWLDYV